MRFRKPLEIIHWISVDFEGSETFSQYFPRMCDYVFFLPRKGMFIAIPISFRALHTYHAFLTTFAATIEAA